MCLGPDLQIYPGIGSARIRSASTSRYNMGEEALRNEREISLETHTGIECAFGGGPTCSLCWAEDRIGSAFKVTPVSTWTKNENELPQLPPVKCWGRSSRRGPTSNITTAGRH